MIRMTIKSMALVFLLSVNSCKEAYFPDNVISIQQIPVIEGIILENQSPVVNLSWTNGYSETGSVRPIENAEVLLGDDLGNLTTLYGFYGRYSSDYIKGQKGRTYTLFVTLPDGSKYESLASTLGDNQSVRNIKFYANQGLRTINSNNSNGYGSSVSQKGLFIKADLSCIAGNEFYFRFSSSVIKESFFIRSPNSMYATEIYAWDKYIPGSYFNSGQTITDVSGQQVLKEQDICFLLNDFNPSSGTANQTPAKIAAWIVTVKVYTISREAYSYYRSVQLQINSNDQIFAPEPAKVKSMFRCTSNPGMPVIGVFEASSEKEYTMAFGWREFSGYYYRDLRDFPVITAGGEMEWVWPEWWIWLP